MIYVIRAVGSDFVKIGYTKSKRTLPRRLKTLKGSCPFKLIIEAEMEGSKLKERCLHSFCISRHESGEWFRLTEDEIKRMIAKYSNWTPSKEGFGKMSAINHNVKKINKKYFK
jgi:hypothetical protein